MDFTNVLMCWLLLFGTCAIAIAIYYIYSKGYSTGYYEGLKTGRKEYERVLKESDSIFMLE